MFPDLFLSNTLSCNNSLPALIHAYDQIPENIYTSGKCSMSSVDFSMRNNLQRKIIFTIHVPALRDGKTFNTC